MCIARRRPLAGWSWSVTAAYGSHWRRQCARRPAPARLSAAPEAGTQVVERFGRELPGAVGATPLAPRPRREQTGGVSILGKPSGDRTRGPPPRSEDPVFCPGMEVTLLTCCGRAPSAVAPAPSLARSTAGRRSRGVGVCRLCAPRVRLLRRWAVKRRKKKEVVVVVVVVGSR